MRIVGFVAVAALALVALFAFGLIGRGINTANRMANQTVFNADRHVWSYEQFKAKYENYVQYDKQVKQAEAQLDTLRSRGVNGGQEYNNLVMERDGSRQMKNRIAADYNTMSRIAYQAIWKERGLPDQLE